MQRFSTNRDTGEDLKSSKEKNAFGKLKGLQARRAPIFWALGPDDTNKVYRMTYADRGAAIFKSAPDEALSYTAA
jgi:hypothetical protein